MCHSPEEIFPHQLIEALAKKEVQLEMVPWDGSPDTLSTGKKALVRLSITTKSQYPWSGVAERCAALGHITFYHSQLVDCDGHRHPVATLVAAAERLVEGRVC